MSQKTDEIVTDNAAECLIDTKAITRTTTKLHRIRWAIENVSQLPLDTKIIGPDFYLTKTCLCNILIRKAVRHLFVYLHNKSDRIIKIERNLVLFDCEGTVLHQDEMGSACTLEKKDVNAISTIYQRNQFDFLKNDILIIDCCLKVEGCITTEISSFKSERESREHLINDLKTMFNNPVDSDFTLQVGNEIIHSHKSLLRARSAYFKRMFEIEMKESAENSVSISDVSHPTMQKLVEFLYTGDFTGTLEDNIQQISDLYYAADKYEVRDLRALCADKLVSTATADSICQILQLAQRHNDADLKIRAMNFISFHFDEIEKTNVWKTFISSELALASEVLSFCFKRLKFIP
ncbi:TD and POZ domain-containing protein 2 [Araneus ventricosus]|uniref:TD and POZ domain-containing protein 2 n=1 Tax=Araneus ventricosus TaxID=182803 RepID=A0A4Y2C3M9_ARAVE|nr:TD and POZ domain-containing protein 2 [Araneus ventricosus]